jgi:hypothetical protein
MNRGPLELARWIPDARGQDFQKLRKVVGVVVRSPNEREIDRLAVDLKSARGQRVPQIAMALDFESTSQIFVSS